MNRVTFYTENKFTDTITAYLNGHPKVQGYTLYTGVGYWNSTREENLTIVIIGELAYSEAKVIAKYIKELNKQEAVLFTIESVISEVIS